VWPWAAKSWGSSGASGKPVNSTVSTTVVAIIRDAAIASGMITLVEDVLAKVKSRVTCGEELFRVVTGVKETRACPSGQEAVGADFMGPCSCRVM